MRSKEVENAIELLEKIKVNKGMNVYITSKDSARADELLKYIEGLEGQQEN